MRLPHVAPFGNAPLYFFTACTQNRRPLLAAQGAFDVLHEIWRRSAEVDGWFVGRFVIMPDHVHFFAKPTLSSKSREVWIKMWKSVSARCLCTELNLKPPVWQSDTFDHLLRSAESFEEKWAYVRQNPVRAGLTSKAEDWPWQGEVHALDF